MSLYGEQLVTPEPGWVKKWKYFTHKASSCPCQGTPPFLSSCVFSEQQTHLPAPRSPSPKSTQFPLCPCLAGDPCPQHKPFMALQLSPSKLSLLSQAPNFTDRWNAPYQFLYPWTPALSSPAGKRNFFQITYFYFCLPVKPVSCACGKYHWQLEHVVLLLCSYLCDLKSYIYIYIKS